MADPAEVDRRIEGLTDRHGSFPVGRNEYDLDPGSHRRARDLHEAGVVGGVRVWVERDDSVLLVRERSRPDTWGIPGGLIEPGERVEATGRREVREETGIECRIRDVAFASREVYRPADGEDPTVRDLAVCLVADHAGGELRRQEAEIAEVEWFDALPDEVHPPAPRLAGDRL